MHAWESIQLTIEYIEQHIDEELELENLASQANLSKFYYQRLFKRLVKKTVMEYIKLRRLARASEYLKEHKGKILNIALACGFENHETFTRAFKDTYAITPEAYRQHPIILNHCMKPELIINYAMVDEDVPLITDRMVLEISRKQIDKEQYYVGYCVELPISELSGGQDTGIASVPPLWEKLHQHKGSIPGVIRDCPELGVLYVGEAALGNCMYMACVQVEKPCKIEEFSTFTLPPQQYLVCGFEAESEHELYSDCVYKADIFTQRWMESHNLVNKGDFALEVYYPKTDTPYLEHWSIVEGLG